MNDFARLIYKLRKEKYLTQVELGEILGISDKAISKWENGESYPETIQLISLSKYFNITIDELLKGEIREKNLILDEPTQNEDNKIQPEINLDKDIESTIKNKKFQNYKKMNKIDLIIRFIVTSLYLFIGFKFKIWHPTWVIFIIGGILCAIIDVKINKNKIKKIKNKI